VATIGVARKKAPQTRQKCAVAGSFLALIFPGVRAQFGALHVQPNGAAMSQITLYLDADTQALVEQAAAANGLSKSRWVAELIRQHADHEWPRDCLAAAGQFADFPLRDDGAVANRPPAVPRLGF
jgi:hypothetical protein